MPDLGGGAGGAVPQDLLAVGAVAGRGERVGGGDQAPGGQRGRLPQQGRPVGAEPGLAQRGGEQRETGGGPVRGLRQQGVRLAGPPGPAQPGQSRHGPGDRRPAVTGHRLHRGGPLGRLVRRPGEPRPARGARTGGRHGDGGYDGGRYAGGRVPLPRRSPGEAGAALGAPAGFAVRVGARGGVGRCARTGVGAGVGRCAALVVPLRPGRPVQPVQPVQPCPQFRAAGRRAGVVVAGPGEVEAEGVGLRTAGRGGEAAAERGLPVGGVPLLAEHHVEPVREGVPGAGQGVPGGERGVVQGAGPARLTRRPSRARTGRRGPAAAPPPRPRAAPRARRGQARVTSRGRARQNTPHQPSPWSRRSSRSVR
ncbi:hypothetical protein SFUMM280S_04568 [Streptomyces fumanus]